MAKNGENSTSCLVYCAKSANFARSSLVTPTKQGTRETKNILFSAVALLTGWFAATHVSGTQSRYAQDVADYQAAATGDSLPTQARLTKSRSQALIELVGATTRFRETEAPRLPEVLAASKQDAGGRIGVIEKLLTTAFRYIGVPYRSGQSGPPRLRLQRIYQLRLSPK